MNYLVIKGRDLSERIADKLRDEILAAKKPGEKLETLRTLCRRFDVSSNTIRGALKILEREGLVELWHGSGIYVADPLPGPKPVGILVEHDILHPRASRFFAQVIRQLRISLKQQGFETTVYFGHTPLGAEATTLTNDAFYRDLGSGRLSGVVAVCTNPLPELFARAAAAGVPVVSDATDLVEYSRADNVEVVRQGVRELVAQGCRRLAFLSWRSPGRVETWQETLREEGLEIRSSWIRQDLPPELMGAGWEEFREVWTAHTDKPDGLLVVDDLLFREVEAAVTELGIRVPEQLRIVAAVTAGEVGHCLFPVTLLESDPAKTATRLTACLLQKLGRPVPMMEDTFGLRVVRRPAGVCGRNSSPEGDGGENVMRSIVR